MIIIYSFLLLFFLLLMPKLFCFLYLVFRYVASNNENNKIFNYSDVIIFLYMAICSAVMLAQRPFDVGKEIGFGEDMWHYYNAFEWVINSSWYEFLTDFTTVTNFTGSAEPLFWLVIKLLSVISHSSFYIHILLTFLGCLLVFLAGKMWCNSGLLFVFLYTNTITFFAFQGSAIRSGFAFCFLLFAFVLFLKKKNNYYIYLSPTIHFSMTPIPLLIYMSSLDFKKTKNYYKLFFVTGIMSCLIFYFSMRSLDSGLGAKLTSKLSDENKIDIVSTIQFLIENFITFIVIFILFKKTISKELKIGLLLFFFICISMLFVSPSSFSRFYRYEYIYFLIVYSLIFINSSRVIRLTLLSFSLGWFIFLGYDRFVGVFADNIFDYLGYNILFRFD